jgi:hypothetical protein
MVALEFWVRCATFKEIDKGSGKIERDTLQHLAVSFTQALILLVESGQTSVHPNLRSAFNRLFVQLVRCVE